MILTNLLTMIIPIQFPFLESRLSSSRCCFLIDQERTTGFIGCIPLTFSWLMLFFLWLYQGLICHQGKNPRQISPSGGDWMVGWQGNFLHRSLGLKITQQQGQLHLVKSIKPTVHVRV